MKRNQIKNSYLGSENTEKQKTEEDGGVPGFEPGNDGIKTRWPYRLAIPQ